jgi:hypothetical protein
LIQPSHHMAVARPAATARPARPTDFQRAGRFKKYVSGTSLFLLGPLGAACADVPLSASAISVAQALPQFVFLQNLLLRLVELEQDLKTLKQELVAQNMEHLSSIVTQCPSWTRGQPGLTLRIQIYT